MDRHFAQNLPVQLDVSQRQPVNETGIGQTAHFGGCLDADDPQGAEFTLAVATIAIGEHPVSDDGLFDEPQQILSAAVAPFDFAKQTLMGSTSSNAKTNTHNDIR